MGADRALRIRQVVGAGDFDVTLAADVDGVTGGLHLAGLGRAQEIHETAASHDGGRFQSAHFEKRGGEIGQRDEIVDDATGAHARSADRERDASAEVIEVAFAVAEPRRAVVAADNDDRVVQFADLGQAREQDAEGGVDGLRLTEVVGEIFAQLRHVGQIRGHFSFQRVGVDAPEFFAGAVHPLAVRRGRAEPIAEGLAGLPGSEEVVEIAADLIVDRIFCRCERLTLRDHSGDVGGKLVKPTARFLVGVFSGAVGSIVGRAGTPDFIGLTEVVAGLAQHERIGRIGIIPDGTA